MGSLIPASTLDAVAARYARLSPWAAGFARGKTGGDPAFAAVLTLLAARPAARVIDVGCGEGYLLALLTEQSALSRGLGIDHDTRRLAQARAALSDVPGLSFEALDVRHARLPDADLIVVLDVLHYLPPADQSSVIGALAAALQPGGTLLVRDGVAGLGWRSAASWMSERLLVAIGRHRGDGVFFQPLPSLEQMFRDHGLTVTTRPCWRGTPFANVMIEARRPEMT